MGDPGYGPGFTLKSFELPGGGARRCQHFDRDRALELWVSSVINLAHPAGPQRRQDLVSTKSLSDSQDHECSSAEIGAYSTPMNSFTKSCPTPAVSVPDACDFHAVAA